MSNFSSPIAPEGSLLQRHFKQMCSSPINWSENGKKRSPIGPFKSNESSVLVFKLLGLPAPLIGLEDWLA
eukprot:scaffold19_cov114-Cylindrotheca_fusiformis.AAC.33